MKVAMVLSTILPAAVTAAEPQQCYGHTPMESVRSFLGAEIDYATSEKICCKNHRFAEYSGYLAAPEVDLFDRLDANEETVWYDSVCGLPLFVSPRGRTFEEFQEESLTHGWPSFRSAEIVAKNVIIHANGRMESICRTHLGHNLPSGGADRYCIDLVCIAGAPLTPDDARFDILSQLEESALLQFHELGVDRQKSGRTGKVMIGVLSMFAAGAAAFGVYGWKKKKNDQYSTVQAKVFG